MVIDAMSGATQRTRKHSPRGPSVKRARNACVEEARGKVQKFLNAPNSREIIFVRGTTKRSTGGADVRRANVGRGDEGLSPSGATLEHRPGRCFATKGRALRVCDHRRGRAAGRPARRITDGAYEDRYRCPCVDLSARSSNCDHRERRTPEVFRPRRWAQAVAHMPVDVQRSGRDFMPVRSQTVRADGHRVLWGRSRARSDAAYQGAAT